ncbi:phospholipid carrier-dependent glycosyltransferase [bacterium]|nr:phospholipid carrier-dependent glycosyltransferase [bacterium]
MESVNDLEVTPEPVQSRRFSTATILIAAMVGIVLLRLLTLGTLALTDNTEGRYASIGWEMFHSGDWVTPRLYLRGELVPFWGKPPLLFWMTSASFHLFGVSEWPARFPNTLMGILIVLATMRYARQFGGPRVSLLTGLVLASTGLIFVLSGACVLDMSLTAATTGSMLAFAVFAESEGRSKLWGLMFFLMLGIGCLAKGPLAIVLVGLVIAPWLLLVRRFSLIRRIPWFSGTALLAAVTVPWYLLAEQATPGFLWYFIVNEHILRYVTKDYGDLYGAGRVKPYGTSWAFLALAFLPWTPLLIQAWATKFHNWRALLLEGRDPWLLYTLLWGLMPTVFFTVARQIQITYVLPGLPGMAVLMAVGLVRWMDSPKRSTLLWTLRNQSVITALLLIAGIVAEVVFAAPLPIVLCSAATTLAFIRSAWVGHRQRDPESLLAGIGFGTSLLIVVGSTAAGPLLSEKNSTRTILAEVAEQPSLSDRPVMFPLGDPYSADIYQSGMLHGQVDRNVDRDASAFREELWADPDRVFVLRRSDWSGLDTDLKSRLQPAVETEHWIACTVELPAIAETPVANPAPVIASRTDPAPHRQRE